MKMPAMDKKADLRVIKTKKNIKESFIFLLENKSFKDITIQNIIDTALINRSTFYKYYKDKYDLAEQLSDEYIQQAKSYLKDRFKERKDQDLTYVVKKIYAHLIQQKSYILSLWKIETDIINVYRGFESLLKESCKEYLLTEHKTEEIIAGYHSCLYASVILTTIR
jgi:AcrR family transcriptional regulator